MANGIVLNIDTTKSEFQNPMVQLRQGDGNYQSLAVTVTSNGEPFDLTGWTTTFMGTTASGFKIVDSAVTVTNALQGEFTYTPTKAWGQDQGEFKNAYFKFTKSDETASGASLRVNVLDAVDLTAEEAGDYISIVDAMIDQVKTDMDSKLADTKKTLSDTQTQANTVQSNVNDLNTNVNQLKQQNNNIRTSDNTWTGNNTFTMQILGNLNIPSSPETDLNNLNLSGNYKITTSNLNIPSNMPNGAVISVFNFDTNFIYQIIKARYSYSSNSGKVDTWVRTKSINIWGDWRLYAMDDSVLHNTGNETIAGSKTFTSNINGSLSGNSSSATKLQTPRKLKVNLASTDDKTFDGSADQVSVGVSGVLPIVNGGTGRTDGLANPLLVGLSAGTDLNTITTSGYYKIDGSDLNIPAGMPNGAILFVSNYDNTVGYQQVVARQVTESNTNVTVWYRLRYTSWGAWHSLSKDDEVVHNTGTETIAGNKTFTGNTNFTGKTTLNAGNYGLRVTTSGVQKTSDNGVTWTNI